MEQRMNTMPMDSDFFMAAATTTTQETREDEHMIMEEEQLYQENIDNNDDTESSSVIAPPIHQVSDESRQQRESPVLLSARCDSMYEEEDQQHQQQSEYQVGGIRYNTFRSPEEERRTSPVSTNFLRSETELPSTMPPSFPPFLSDAAMISNTSLVPSPLNLHTVNAGGNNKRDKPTLLRSLAWSQDSQEERRMTKRRKEEPNVLQLANSSSSPTTPTSTTTVLEHAHHRRTNSNSPTMVHWEEKIEVMELSDVLHKAIQQGTPTH